MASLQPSLPWRVLDLEHDSLPPRLLVKTKLDSSGYSIHLTDLSRVWGETLTKRGIEQRASEHECGIDPGDGPDQYKILLDKITAALDQKYGTALTMRTSPSNQDSSDDLVLGLSAPLPSPLPQFKWDINLTPLPQHHVADELVMPLLQQSNKLQAQIQSLINELHDKDRIISKITDRLETSGNDLTTIFPGVSNIKVSRKKSQREQLARHVTGLADFDEHAWRAGGRHKLNLFNLGTSEQLNNILQDLPATSINEKGAADRWWTGLGKVGVSSSTEGGAVGAESTSSNRPLTRSTNGLSETDEDDADDVRSVDNDQDGEFQRQGTPSQSKQTNAFPPQTVQSEPNRQPSQDFEIATGPKSGQSEESTEDEDDLDAAPRAAQSRQRSGLSAHATQNGTAPGTIASPESKHGRIEDEEPFSSTSTQSRSLLHGSNGLTPAKPRGKLGTIGGKPKVSATPEPVPDTSEASPAKPRSKLGTFGGKSKSATSPAPETNPSAYLPAKSHKLGSIGGKKQDAVAEPSKSRAAAEASHGAEDIKHAPEPQSRAPARIPAKEFTPPPAQTEEERANKKRDELKRQVDDKAKVPAKKKRKF